MTTPTIHHKLLALTAITILTVVYTLMAAALLRAQNNDIVFTGKEIQGLSDFSDIAELYLAINRTGTPRQVAARDFSHGLATNRTDLTPLLQRINEAAARSMDDQSKTFRDIMRDIGETSNLILDPALSSYYAATLLINEMPSFIDQMAQKNQDKNIFSVDLSYPLEDFHHSVDAICATSIDDCSNLISLQSTFEQHVTKHGLSGLSDGQKRPVFDTIEAIMKSAEHVLKSILDTRREKQVQQLNEAWTVMLILYAILVSLIAFSIRNYASKREINLAHELADKNEELEKFAYAAAHDLKEPVRTMRCYATLIRNEAASSLDPLAEKYVGIIEGAAKRAEQMINDLLGYTRVGEEGLVPEPIDTRQEINAVLEDLKQLLDIVKPEIVISNLPTITTVPSMFRRVMTNLIDNAVKYRRPDVSLRLSIKAEKLGDYWVFSIEDNGIGIAEDYIETVFEPFRRLHQDLTTEGQGIGLTSCRKIVERLKGKIWIRSKVNIGTTVSFSLPVDVDEIKRSKNFQQETRRLVKLSRDRLGRIISFSPEQ